MTYQQTINYLYAQLPMYSRIGAAAYKEDLHNTIALCNAIDNPQTKFKSIHIAGTNGKGSTSHMLAAMLQQAGYKTGLYTSPHLKDFRERIKINGEMISEDFVVDFVERTKTVSEEIKPSFFELTVAMAFDYFEKEKVDIAIIETGLGGRLDSTNIITPLLSIITNIGYDHMDLLGNTLEKIASEKAGIIKPNVPVIIGEYLPETKNIFIEKATQCHAPIYFAQDEYAVSNIHYTMQLLSCDITSTEHNITETFELDLNGFYQTKNIRTVLCAEGILTQLGFPIKNEDEKQALKKVKKLTGLYGRWDVISSNPTIILDVAHNEDGIKQLLNQLSIVSRESSVVSREKAALHFIIGMVKDKDISKVLSILPKNAQYYFCNAHIERALPHKELLEKAKIFELNGESFDDVNEAIKAAKLNAAADGIIIVCGSVFLVAEVA
ncbi:MAG: bifunctional folylpolyglutamate synthase/dihydrofolate synthase [Chitinophagaceae bacterium]|nr:bifunctional folylpolyglutamate synthase/dihydrofolate synthase [Chitinophagaceae bacterium]